MRVAKDDSWRGLQTAWDRLRWARRLKYETAQAAAEAMGIRANTYTGYERGPDSSKSSELGYKEAKRFGGMFGVRWEWLLDGTGDPYRADPFVEKAKEIFEAIPPARREEALDLLRVIGRKRA